MQERSGRNNYPQIAMTPGRHNSLLCHTVAADPQDEINTIEQEINNTAAKEKKKEETKKRKFSHQIPQCRKFSAQGEGGA